tara:strand:- start:104 stop:274 length:171 start_codon:yes stop_codon:yes gene_type:complete
MQVEINVGNVYGVGNGAADEELPYENFALRIGVVLVGISVLLAVPILSKYYRKVFE